MRTKYTHSFKILDHIESLFGNSLNQLKWMNWGGGHKLTDENYNTSDLIKKSTNGNQNIIFKLF